MNQHQLSEKRLSEKLARIKSGEMKCYQPGTPKDDAETKQAQAQARVEFQLSEVKKVITAEKKDSK